MHGRSWVQLWRSASILIRELGAKPAEFDGRGREEQHVFTNALLMTIQCMDATADEIGSPLGEIRWHPTEIEHHGVLLSHGHHRLQRFFKLDWCQNKYIVPAVWKRMVHIVMMVR